MINHEILIKLGFEKIENYYSLKKTINEDGFYILIKYDDNELNIEVYDDLDNLYLPYKITNSSNPYAEEVKCIANNIIQDINKQIFDNNKNKEKIVNYIKEKFNVNAESPWMNNPENLTFKTLNSNKWFALLLQVKNKVLGLSDNNLSTVLNIKLNGEEIEQLIDNKTYFNAYHMNKKHWISILINDNIDFKFVCDLINKSFYLVEKATKK